MIYFVFPAYKQPLLYNISVGRELLKQIYIAEGLQPPTSISTIRSAYETIWSRVKSPAYWRGIVSSGEIVNVGVYAVEAYAIFKVSLMFLLCYLSEMLF
jgi:Mitochondrial ATP synthase g subunit.